MRDLKQILADCDERERAARKATPMEDTLHSQACNCDECRKAWAHAAGLFAARGECVDRLLQACADTRDLVRRVEEAEARAKEAEEDRAEAEKIVREYEISTDSLVRFKDEIAAKYERACVDVMQSRADAGAATSDAARWKALAEQLAGALRHEHPLDTGAPGCVPCAALAAFDAATRPQTLDDALVAEYERILSERTGTDCKGEGRADGVLDDIRAAIAAPSDESAALVLDDRGWGHPEHYAAPLRRVAERSKTRPQTAGGEGE